MIAWIKDTMSAVWADIKKAHKSLTILFNSFWLGFVEMLPYAKEVFPEMKDYLPAELYTHVFVIVVIGNIVLRFKTKQPLRSKL